MNCQHVFLQFSCYIASNDGIEPLKVQKIRNLLIKLMVVTVTVGIKIMLEQCYYNRQKHQFPMENNTTRYQLAHTYNSYIKNKFKNRCSLDHYPSFIPEQLDSPRNLLFPAAKNIFSQHADKAGMRKLQNLAEVNYKLVGVKEVKSYQQRLEKKRRHQNSMVKQSDSVLSLSHLSNIRMGQDPQRLTKEQVMRLYTAPDQTNNKIGEQIYLNSKNSDRMQTTMNSNCIGRDEVTYMTNFTLQRTQKHHFAVSKIKERLEGYQKNWQKIIGNKEFTTVHKQKGVHKKLTSLLERVDNFRQLTEERQERTIHEQQENIQPKQWDRILRTSISLRQLQKKQRQHVVKIGISCSGRQKLGKQIAWIEKKEKQGCYFRSSQIKQRESMALYN